MHDVKYELRNSDKTSTEILPTAGEYANAEEGECAKEINEFKKEMKIKN